MNRFNIWIVLLLVSVLINGALIGAGARSWFAPPPVDASEAGAPGLSRGFDLRAFLQALPADARAEARSRARAERRALRSEVRDAALARRAAHEALTAEPFDPDAAARALAEARAARAALQARAEAMILDLAAGLSPQDRRAALSAALGPPRFPRRPDGPDRDAAPGGPPDE